MLLLCRKLCRVRDVGELSDNLNRGWKLFVRSARASRFSIFFGIGLGLLVGAVITQADSIEVLKMLNEDRAYLVEVTLEFADVRDKWAEKMGDAEKLRYEAIELREKVMNLEGTEEEINTAKARIQEIEIELETVEAQRAAIEASMSAIEARRVGIEGGITVQEQSVDYYWRLSSLLLSIGMLVFSSGLALWIHKISRERA